MSYESDIGKTRVSVRVDVDLKKRMDNVFKWGEFNNVMVEVLNWICDMHDRHGDAAFLLFRSGRLQEFFKKEGLSNE